MTSSGGEWMRTRGPDVSHLVGMLPWTQLTMTSRLRWSGGERRWPRGQSTCRTCRPVPVGVGVGMMVTRGRWGRWIALIHDRAELVGAPPDQGQIPRQGDRDDAASDRAVLVGRVGSPGPCSVGAPPGSRGRPRSPSHPAGARPSRRGRADTAAAISIASATLPACATTWNPGWRSKRATRPCRTSS